MLLHPCTRWLLFHHGISTCERNIEIMTRKAATIERLVSQYAMINLLMAPLSHVRNEPVPNQSPAACENPPRWDATWGCFQAQTALVLRELITGVALLPSIRPLLRTFGKIPFSHNKLNAP